MSKITVAKLQKYALAFAALGDKTRLLLLVKLSKGQSQSISQLTEKTKLTRQAVTKHLKALENAGIVRSTYCGRKNVFELDTHPFTNITEYLNFISQQWDQALSRLKLFVEN